MLLVLPASLDVLIPLSCSNDSITGHDIFVLARRSKMKRDEAQSSLAGTDAMVQQDLLCVTVYDLRALFGRTLYGSGISRRRQHGSAQLDERISHQGRSATGAEPPLDAGLLPVEWVPASAALRIEPRDVGDLKL